MILSRSPLRISLGGGGTDLASYYSKHGGFLIAAGINRYCSILVSKRFHSTLRLSYSEMEIKDNIEEIKHPIFRESLKFLGLTDSIEVHSVSDVPAGTGLGSSSVFTVTLLNALHTYKREYLSQKQLAEEAAHIEIDVLGSPIGKQDHYAGAMGGINCYTFEKDGNVIVEPLKLSENTLDQLENDFQYYYTGVERNANEILQEQDAKSKSDDISMMENLHRVKDIGLRTRKILEKGEVLSMRDLLREHWELKKKRSNKMTSSFIDECYEEALKSGANAGKLIGAGGSGFFMFYVKDGAKVRLNQAMKKMGLRLVRFNYDFEGTKILVNA